MKLPLRSFAFLPRSFVGVDIGTSAIKIVELSRWGDRKSLKNYGEIQVSALYEQSFRTFEKNALLLSSSDIARSIRAILLESKISTKAAVFSLPDFSSFFMHFQLPSMSREELPQAVQFEARKYVPLPLSEVIFDWQIIEQKPQPKSPLHILSVAVPREVVSQYEEIAGLAGLELHAIEAEVFGCIRALVQDMEPVIVMDIGAQSTTVNVVWKKALRTSHSLDIAGINFTERLSQSFSVDRSKAEDLKRSVGLQNPEYEGVLAPLLDMLFSRVQKIAQDFHLKENKDIEKIILAGGSALIPGLSQYVERTLHKRVEIANPFQHLFYPPILEDALQQKGPSYTVAVGMALRGLE
ncbi:MAG: type IV pilus assembly protein PilM [Candidatus Wildermuthbacteria bacterium]|nr:type IV pilus assembly protein PilM [Candidatus Wildermuthbacteria bacterium]